VAARNLNVTIFAGRYSGRLYTAPLFMTKFTFCSGLLIAASVPGCSQPPRYALMARSAPVAEAHPD
jgi:hypothetical protein